MPKRNLLNESKCKDCESILTLENAVFIGLTLLGRCKICHNKTKQNYSKNNPHVSRNANLKKYDINQEQYEILFKLQNGVCAICKNTTDDGMRLSIDHNHDTKEVRGLLCRNCNAALGNLKEDEDIIWNMLEYLKKYNWKKAS